MKKSLFILIIILINNAFISQAHFTGKVFINSFSDKKLFSVANFDFTYKQDVCDPLSVQFFNVGINSSNPYWSFGDGITITGNFNPVHKYSAPGNYTVKYSAQNVGLPDTVTKTISVSIIYGNIIITPDTTICFGSTKKLSSVSSSLSYCWSPSTYLDDPNSQNPTTSTPQNITYYFNAEVTAANVIVNGDFDAGNTGFTSEYSYASANTTEGEYFVGSSPQAWNSSLSNCSDHTSNGGNMLLVNGAPVPEVNVWKETVSVTPNTNYAFSTWVQALYPPNPAQLQFSINGSSLGSLITASLPTCTWTQFYTTWNSGNLTSAVISIVNKNTFVQGNDFALDDISFAPVFVKRDSVVITVNKPTVKTNNDTTVCTSAKVQLNSMGASSYTWSPVTNLSNSSIANPIATINNSTTYIVTGTTVNGCIAKDTVAITLSPKPLINIINDTTICKNTGIQLFATGGLSYLWSPASGLNNPNISTPIATPINTTTYYVSVKNAFGCSNNDSVKISVNGIPVITKSNDTAICEGSLVQLFASGGVSYSWLPSSTLNNPNISNPIATPVNSTTYFVTAKNISGCANTDSVKIFTKPLPVISISNDTSVCDNIAVQLFASGGSTYVWSPTTTLNNPSINNPTATPLSTTTYKAVVTTSGGCSQKDSVTIITSPLPIISKTNDTSICSNTSLQLFASGGSTYLWTPSSGLSNQNINNPIAKPVTTTTYFIKVSNNPGCFKKDSVKVSIYPKAIITITNDTLVCSNANTQLLAGGGNLYKWSPAATLTNSNIPNPIATPLSTTTYFVNITDMNSCSYNDSVKLSVKTPVVFAISADDSICSKSSAQLFASGGDNYLWQPANFISDQNIFNPIASPDVTTVYSVKIKDKTCRDSATLSTQITVLSLPVINATKSNDIDCSSGFSQLNASGAINYLWTPVSFLNKNDIANPVATPTSNTLFTVTGVDNFGCQNTDTITVIAKFTDPSLYLMPNSFTPNGDGLNDCFGPKYWGTIQELDFNIYNRFGEKVFHTENSSACWDGKYKGKLQDVNVFVYTIKAKTVCGTVNKKGVFTLLK